MQDFFKFASILLVIVLISLWLILPFSPCWCFGVAITTSNNYCPQISQNSADYSAHCLNQDLQDWGISGFDKFIYLLLKSNGNNKWKRQGMHCLYKFPHSVWIRIFRIEGFTGLWYRCHLLLAIFEKLARVLRYNY